MGVDDGWQGGHCAGEGAAVGTTLERGVTGVATAGVVGGKDLDTQALLPEV